MSTRFVLPFLLLLIFLSCVSNIKKEELVRPLLSTSIGALDIKTGDDLIEAALIENIVDEVSNLPPIPISVASNYPSRSFFFLALGNYQDPDPSLLSRLNRIKDVVRPVSRKKIIDFHARDVLTHEIGSTICIRKIIPLSENSFDVDVDYLSGMQRGGGGYSKRLTNIDGRWSNIGERILWNN